MFLAANSFAEIYVIYDKDTKEIWTVSGKDDTALPKGMEKATLQGEMDSYEFPAHPTNCFFKEGKFVVNGKKIDADYQKKLIDEEIAEEEALIKTEIRKQTIATLKEEGKIKHIEK